MNYFYCILTILIIFISKFDCDLNCINGKNAVDWFIVYKLPLLEDSKVINIKHGVAQLYMDNKNPSWTYLNDGIDSKYHPIYQTLQQIYKKTNSTMSLMYNDEEPDLYFKNVTKTTNGHTKGVLAGDMKSGFWLIHSIPKFPPIISYAYPNSGKIYGQTIICVSIKYNQLNLIGKQLRYYWPNIYQKQFPQEFVANNSHIKELLDGHNLGKTFPFSNIFNLKSSAGKCFISFAKSCKFNDDLYSGLVAPSLFSTIDVESWKNGAAQDLPSNCSGQYHVQNVDALNLLGNSFDSAKDHSKWAISTIDYMKSTQNHWLCIGDINRQVY